MRALAPRWQKAVVALFLTKGNRTAALRAAGYKANKNAIGVLASRMFADDRMRAAVREVALAQIDIAEPELLGVTLSIMRNTKELGARQAHRGADGMVPRQSVQQAQGRARASSVERRAGPAALPRAATARGADVRIPRPLRSQRPGAGAGDDRCRGCRDRSRSGQRGNDRR